VIWVTGDNRHPDGYYALSTPLTVADQAILVRYLDGGGRLLALGQNLAEASDVNGDADPVFGRSALYHQYLGAHWLQGSLYGPDGGASLPPGGGSAVFGLPETFLAGVGLDLGADGDGAGNQVSVDEIAPGGLLDGQDAALVYAVLAATGGQPLAEGFVGLAKACEPSLDDATAHCPYRTLYYSFGPEGINDDAGGTTRADLLDRSLRWLLDDVSAALEPEYVGAPGEPLVVRAVAGATYGEMESFRWRVGDRVVDTAEPQVTLYLESGKWPITVEALDSFGHRAVASTSARIIAGGASSLDVSPTWALPGAAVTFTVRLRHEGLASLAMAVSMPLAEGLEFVSLEGGSCSEGLWSWAGQVGPGEERILTLVARLADGAKGFLSSTATFTAGEATFQRRADVTVGTRMLFPLVTRNGTP